MNGEIRIPTSAGEIGVYKNVDSGYPGVSIMFKPLGSDYEIDITYIEVKENENDFDNVHVYTYENVFTEEFTRKFTINKMEVLAAFNAVE